MNEKELVRKAQSGDFEAFSQLIEKYKNKIYNLALKFSKNRQDAEDVLQDTFLKAVDNIDKFRGDSAFGTWLYTIAVNIMRAQYSKDQKADLRPIEEYLPEGHGDNTIHIELFDWGNPQELMEQKELKQAIDNALAELPQKYSMPFILRYFEDMQVSEIANVMKLTVPAAKSRILRARLALREKLSELFREKIDERVQ